MEKKTIGSFIAVLRKANGMTQKELAEMLNVSDKTVSRWERDESTPDLTLIPIIAEIFGVTSDELIRGEIMPEKSYSEKPNKAMKEKQLQRIAESSKTKFSVRSIISIGISIIGIIAAMIANFGFTRGTIGFFVCCAFITASVICEIVFIILAFSSVNTQDYEEEAVNGCRKKFFETACFTFYIIAAEFASALPLILVTGGDGYLGVLFGEWLVSGLIFATATAVICYIFNIFIKKYALKKEIYKTSEEEMSKTNRISTLTFRSLFALIVAVSVTFAFQFTVNEIMTPLFFAKSTVFENYDDFKEFMETDMPDTSYIEVKAMYATQTMPNYEDASGHEEITYYDNYGNEISEEEALTEYVYDRDSHVLCQYINRNQSVYSIKYNRSADNLLPITVYTYEQFYDGRETVETFNVFFMAAYIAQASITVFVYFSKRRKI